jgi:hypothetical protein
MEALYKDEYSKLDRRCNKMSKISDNRLINSNVLTENSIYLCSDGENNVSTEFQYANHGASALVSVNSTIFDRADSDIRVPIDVDYKLYQIDWPTVKEDLIPQSLKKLEKKNPKTAKQDKYIFVESDKEFLGQYLLGHQCTVNVPFYDCIKFCEQNQKCAGTEWNEAMVKTDGKSNYVYENVCCPKSIIKEVIPRRNEFNRGKFYVKKKLDEMPDRDKILVTKSDLNKMPPMNDRFALQTAPTIIDRDNPKQQDVSKVKALYENIY